MKNFKKYITTALKNRTKYFWQMVCISIITFPLFFYLFHFCHSIAEFVLISYCILNLAVLDIAWLYQSGKNYHCVN